MVSSGMLPILNYDMVFLGLKLSLVYLREVAEVTRVPTDIRNFDSLFLLINEAEVLFLTVIGFSSESAVENGKNCLRLNSFRCSLGGKKPG